MSKTASDQGYNKKKNSEEEILQKSRDSILTLGKEAPNLWLLSIASGDIYSTITEEIQQTISNARGKGIIAIKDAIKRMQNDDLISKQEAEQINNICKIIFSVARKKQTSTKARKKIVAIYQEMLISSDKGSLALAMASIFANENGPLKVKTPETIPGTLAAVSPGEEESIILITGGLLGGAFAGGKIGGTVGGLVGMAAGAVIGAMVAGCRL